MSSIRHIIVRNRHVAVLSCNTRLRTLSIMPIHPEIARVVFDESHSEAWTIPPAVAREMQAQHPADSSYARAADALRARSFGVEAHTDGALDLGDAAVLVVAHPSEPKWERTVPGSGPPRFDADELDAIERFVAGGGGLILLAEEEQDKYGSNVTELAARFGIGIANDLVSDYEHQHAGAPSWILAEPVRSRAGGAELLARVKQACFYRATSLEPGPGALVVARAAPTASTPGAP